MAICKSPKGELGNGMRGMMGTRESGWERGECRKCGESGWERRESRKECEEPGWECGESG